MSDTIIFNDAVTPTDIDRWDDVLLTVAWYQGLNYHKAF
jgi:hypothetical protein